MLIVHCTTVHVRTDTRIFRKECASLAQHFAKVYLVVGDGQGNYDDPCSSVFVRDIGPPPGGTRFGRIVLQPIRMWRYVKKLNPTVAHFHDPELLPIAFLLSLMGVRVIYDIHEDLPKQIMSKHWIAPAIRAPLARFIRFFENFVSARFAALVTATPAITERFLTINTNTTTINNYPISYELISTSALVTGRRGICYVGGVTRIRGISVILDALLLVPELRLTLCGPFESREYEVELREHRAWRQVDYLGVVDRKQMSDVLESSFAGLVTFLPAPNHVEAQPQKVFEYMSASVPVIGSDFELWRTVIADTGAGLCVDPTDPVAIANACRALMDHPEWVTEMGRRGAELVSSDLNWEHESVKLVDLYKSLEAQYA